MKRRISRSGLSELFTRFPQRLPGAFNEHELRLLDDLAPLAPSDDPAFERFRAELLRDPTPDEQADIAWTCLDKDLADHFVYAVNFNHPVGGPLQEFEALPTGIHIIGERLGDCPSLRLIEFENAQCNDGEAAALARSLRGNITLQELRLLNCALPHQDYTDIAGALETNEGLRSLTIRQPVSDGPWTDALWKGLARNGSLEGVELHSTVMTAEDGKNLVRALLQNRTLRHLTLRGQPVQSIVALLNALAGVPCGEPFDPAPEDDPHSVIRLPVLSILLPHVASTCDVAAFIELLCRALENPHSLLRELHLDIPQMTQEHVGQLIESLRPRHRQTRNVALTQLTFGNSNQVGEQQRVTIETLLAQNRRCHAHLSMQAIGSTKEAWADHVDGTADVWGLIIDWTLGHGTPGELWQARSLAATLPPASDKARAKRHDEHLQAIVGMLDRSLQWEQLDGPGPTFDALDDVEARIRDLAIAGLPLSHDALACIDKLIDQHGCAQDWLNEERRRLAQMFRRLRSAPACDLDIPILEAAHDSLRPPGNRRISASAFRNFQRTLSNVLTTCIIQASAGPEAQLPLQQLRQLHASLQTLRCPE